MLVRGRQTTVQRAIAAGEHDGAGGDGAVRAPMHGKVLTVLVEKGSAVDRGHRLAVIEAMKMEHTLVAPIAGTVTAVTVRAEQQVVEGELLIDIEPA